MKNLLFVALFVGSVLIISGCTTTPSGSTQGLKLDKNLNADETSIEANKDSLSGDAIATGAAKINTTATGVPVAKEQLQTRGGSMRTLADYEPIEGNTVTLQTSKGDIVIELFREQAPLTTLNFLTLVKEGFYDGIVFHRVIPDFMAQFGDPLSKDPAKKNMWGTGGPGFTIADEFSPELKHDAPGIVSMANSGPNTGGSQIFITYEATPWLDGRHAVFGKVVSGMDVATQLSNGDTIITATYR